MKSRSLTVFALTLALLSTSAIASGLLASDADAMNPDEYVPPDSGLTYDVPERYDMRDDYGEPPVRNQNGYGLCWSYASMASCEYLASKDSGDSGYFSPWYNVYQAYDGNGIDRIGDGDEVRYLFETYPDAGGYSWNSIYTVLNWYSPVPESLAPSEGDLFEKNYGPSLRDEVVRINGASIMNCVTDADSVKHKIMEGYAGVFDMYFDRSLRALFDGYNTMNSGGRIDPGTPTNHEVLLIGWDDAYPKENFKYPPSADGAWLIRNSHGTGGNSGNGYIWLSYESKWDASVLFFDRMANESEDAMYFHDRCISIGTDLEFEDAATMANVFHASGRQRISSVGLASFNDAGFDYTIEVYTSLKDVTDPTSGDLESVQKGRIDYAGSHCVGLNHPVEVRTGQTFSICVTYEKPAGVVRVPIDTYEVVSNAEDGYVSDPIAHFGESFVLIDGEWVDISADGMSNVRVRAYADAVEESDAPVIAIAVAIIVAVLGFMVASFRR